MDKVAGFLGYERKSTGGQGKYGARETTYSKVRTYGTKAEYGDEPRDTLTGTSLKKIKERGYCFAWES